MSAKLYKSPISYPYMEKLYIYTRIYIVQLTTEATDTEKVYYVISTQKLYSVGALSGVGASQLANSNVNYRFSNITNTISASISFSANLNYLVTGNTASETTVFTTTTALTGTSAMDFIYLGDTLLDVQNGSIIYNSFGKILRLKDGTTWSHISYYLVLAAENL